MCCLLHRSTTWSEAYLKHRSKKRATKRNEEDCLKLECCSFLSFRQFPPSSPQITSFTAPLLSWSHLSGNLLLFSNKPQFRVFPKLQSHSPHHPLHLHPHLSFPLSRHWGFCIIQKPHAGWEAWFTASRVMCTYMLLRTERMEECHFENQFPHSYCEVFNKCDSLRYICCTTNRPFIVCVHVILSHLCFIAEQVTAWVRSNTQTESYSRQQGQKNR